jgi:hypothetical protein
MSAHNPKVEKAIGRIQNIWRDAGYYFEDDKDGFLFRASKRGFFQLTGTLKEFAHDIENERENHIHLGPYMQLELLASHVFEMTDAQINGQSRDFLSLAELIEKEISDSSPGELHTLLLKEHFDNTNKALKLKVENADFDPSSPDPMLWAR